MNDDLNKRVFPIGKVTTLFLCIFFIIEIFIVFGGLESKNEQINDKIDKIIKINLIDNTSKENKDNNSNYQSPNSETNSVIKEDFEIIKKKPVG